MGKDVLRRAENMEAQGRDEQVCTKSLIATFLLDLQLFTPYFSSRPRGSLETFEQHHDDR